MKIFTLLAAVLISTKFFSQTFTDAPNFFLPDDGGTYNFTIEVSGLPDVIDMSFGIERMCLNMTHSWDSDAWIRLQSPDGTIVDMALGVGDAGDNFMTTCFTENAFLQITQGGPPFDGNFQPQGNLNDFNNGQNPNGTWTFIYWDSYAFADTGTLMDWSITFTNELNNPEPDPYYFEESNLPLLWIDTNGEVIQNEPAVIGEIQVIDNGIGEMNTIFDAFTYEGGIDIELRGQSTQGFPKKSYGFETKDDEGLDMDTTMLLMPADEDWILYAPYSEKSLMQNALAMELGTAMGRYNSRVRYCEVFLNGVYEGIYLMMEKIKQENDRVDIADLNLDENVGEDVTGGYIFRLDWGGETGWQSEYNTVGDLNYYPYYQFVYPRPEVVTIPQQYYLQTYVDSFEYAVNSVDFMYEGKRYDEFIDLPSFVDNFIMNELSKNVDAYRLSSYFSKDKNGRIVCGPLWDFNLSFGNADYCDGTDTDGWELNSCGTIGPNWWFHFLEDSVFTDLLKCRWDELRMGVLSNESLHSRIDSLETLLSSAADRNFERWPVLGIYVWPNSWPYATSFAEAVDQLHAWIDARLAWMDDNITGSPICVPYVVNLSPNTEEFEEDFFPPSCWTTIDADADQNGWGGADPVIGHDSPQCAHSYSTSLNPDNYLVSPMLTPQQDEHLTFWVSNASDDFEETFQVLLSTSGNEASDFTIVLWEETISTDQWLYRAADLSAWEDQNIYIAFRHFDSENNLILKLDDVRYPSWTNPEADCTIGIDEAGYHNFQLFPNPATEQIQVISNQSDNSICIYDALGSLVFEENFIAGTTVISLQHLPRGAYMVELRNNKGISNRKLMVE